MQAHKLSSKINDAGQLIVTEAIDLPPGEVEIIVLQHSAPSTQVQSAPKAVEYKSTTFRDLLEKAKPVPEDFDPDEARWEALKEKHNL